MNIEDFFDSVLKIVSEKKWYESGILPQDFVTNAVNIAESLNNEERDYFLLMLNNFEIYPDPKYQYYLEEILNKISISETNIYVAPLLSQVDISKFYKSSQYIVRRFKSTYIKQLPLFKGKKVQIYSDNCALNDYKLLLVDDYIGTGMTAHSAVDYYLKKGVRKNNILILSYVIMEAGLKKLNKEDLKVVYYKCYKKCISGYYDKKQSQKLIQINSEICNKKIIDKPLGFHNSQSLVGMQRTPNNTLPIFWDDKMGTPLFPRD